MANHKSAAKRARQSLRRRTTNTRTISALRTAEKKLRTAMEGKKLDEAKTLLQNYSSLVDRAAQKGRVHVKLAARKIGRLASQVASLGK